MIISRTPIRITFLGGGTDYPDYFLRAGGETFGMAIDKYSYVVVNPLPRLSSHRFQISYQKKEQVDNIDAIEHPSVRECLRHTKSKSGLEIHYTGDLPARTGLGSSSSFTVGLLNALYAYQGRQVGKGVLAQEACYVEQSLIQERVGCQDQYTCSHGGVVQIHYSTSGSVDLKSLELPPQRLSDLESNLMLFYTGLQRHAHDILKEQLESTSKGDLDEYLHELKGLASAAVDVVVSERDLDELGGLMDMGWNLKTKLSAASSNNRVEEMYQKARTAGAIGGKLLGAGGGGFMLFFVPPRRHQRVSDALNGYQQVKFRCDEQGSRIIFSG